MEGLLILALAPIAVGIAIGAVVGTVKGLVAALLRSEPKPEGGAGEAESETQRPRRKLATEIRHRDKIDSGDVYEGPNDDDSLLTLSDDELAEMCPF